MQLTDCVYWLEFIKYLLVLVFIALKSEKQQLRLSVIHLCCHHMYCRACR